MSADPEGAEAVSVDSPAARRALRAFATRYEFHWLDGLKMTIERYDNHGRLLPDGAWCVACWFSQGDLPNVHYLNSEGRWAYKAGTAFATLDSAWAAYQAAGRPT